MVSDWEKGRPCLGETDKDESVRITQQWQCERTERKQGHWKDTSQEKWPPNLLALSGVTLVDPEEAVLCAEQGNRILTAISSQFQ